jgi:hypothetical protein
VTALQAFHLRSIHARYIVRPSVWRRIRIWQLWLPTMQSIPVGVVTSKAGDQDPAWAPSAHIFYGERVRDFDDDVPKW